MKLEICLLVLKIYLLWCQKRSFQILYLYAFSPNLLLSHIRSQHRQQYKIRVSKSEHRLISIFLTRFLSQSHQTKSTPITSSANSCLRTLWEDLRKNSVLFQKMGLENLGSLWSYYTILYSAHVHETCKDRSCLNCLCVHHIKLHILKQTLHSVKLGI